MTVEKKKTLKAEPLPVGKLDSDLLENLVFHSLTLKRKDVISRSGIGLDCAVLDFGKFECIISTDPISAAINDIGKLAVHISCNDIATNGVEPMAMTLTLMLPVGTTAEDVRRIMMQAGRESAMLGVEIVGGHTEITDAVTRPTAISTCFGKGLKGGTPKPTDLKPGSLLLMTKKAGIEGTGIVCTDFEDRLDFLTKEEISRGQGFLSQVSVVAEGVIAGKIGTLGMHDITEGGVLGAVWEMCQISDLGVRIYGERICVDPITIKIAKHFGIDYLRLISSGAMLIGSKEEKADEIIDKCKDAGIDVNVIGKIVPKEEGRKILTDGILYPAEWNDIESPEGDHLYKIIMR